MAASREREANPSAWSMVDGSRTYIEKAIEALHQLDSGNPVVGRCVEYLSQLSLVLNALSMLKLSSLFFSRPNTMFPKIGKSHFELVSTKIYILVCSLRLTYIADLDQSNFSGADMPNPLSVYPSDVLYSQNTDSLPAMDLGEFMIDQDLDFLGQFFSSAAG